MFAVSRHSRLLGQRFAPEACAERGGSVVEVCVDTVDNFCGRNGIESISLPKIDAQGYDLHVLRGVRRMLDDRRIKLFS